MTRNKFTAEQGTAINTRGADLLISASAGSGKTTVMVERIASMISSGGCELGNLLVLTFTNASAADMKLKLRRRLEGMGIESKNLSEACIGTFHKFCGEVVRTYFNLTGVGPDFTVMDDIAAVFLKQQVLDEIITRNYEKCAGAIETFCINRKTDSFQKMLIRINEFLASRGNAEEWLNNTALATYETDAAMICIKDYYTRAGKYFLSKFSSCEQNKYSEECRNMATQLASVDNYYDLHLLAQTASFTRLGKCNDEEFKKIRNDFKELIKKLEIFKNTEEFMIANGKRDREIIRQVIKIVREFGEAYAKAKLDANKLDFNDLEKYACVVLENPEAAAALRAKYKYIFIDEYQDTNPMQERILAALAGEKNVFMVGDIKQSIYGFRGCEAAIFAGKMTDFDRNLSGKVICLNENFRSRKNILKFANLVFSKVMKQTTCDIDYNATSKFTIHQNTESGAVDITLVNTARGTAPELQAAVIAEKITNLNALGVPLRDIAILSRSRTHFGVLADFLEKAGIAVNVASEQNACELFEIALLNNMLFAVSNFYNNMPLVLLMQSFVFGFTPNELAEIKLSSNEEYLYKNLVKCGGQEKIADFLAFLDKYRALSKSHCVADVLITFLTEFKIIERLLLLPKGKRMTANIYAYLNKLRGAPYAATVGEFLYLLENELIEIKITPAATNDDAVQIITMHSSKGLEFPIVIIFDVGAPFNLNDAKQLMVIDKQQGLCVYTLDADEFTKTASLARLGATISARRVMIAEEMRLLYVAITRAKEKLVIVGGGNLGKICAGCEDYDILCARSDLHFLAPVLFETVRDDCFDLKLAEADDIEMICKNAGVRVLTGQFDGKLADDLRKLYAKEYPYEQKLLKNSVSSLTSVKVTDGIRSRGESGTQLGTEFHKVMQYAAIEQIENLIPEIKGYEVFREIAFLQSVGDTIVQGVIDLLAVKDGHAIIVDYKTTEAAPEKLVEIYMPQLKMYSAAVQQALKPKHINTYIYSTFKKKLIKL